MIAEDAMGRFLYWIRYSLTNRKDCGRCCLRCRYYDICRRDR